MPIRVYLDNCCYSRPYDKTDNIRIILEAQAKLAIQSMIVDNVIELASSSFLLFENNFKKDTVVRDDIMHFIKTYSEYFVKDPNNPVIEKLHDDIMRSGIKSMDAYHLASAIALNCDYFITTDDRMLKHRDNRIKIMNPVQFIIGEV